MASMVGEPKEVLDAQCRNAPQRVTLGQVTLIGVMIRQHVKSKGGFHCGHCWLPSQGLVPWSRIYAMTKVDSRRTGYMETFVV